MIAARLRAAVSRRLTESQKILLRRLRHGEQPWQRTLSGLAADRLSYNLADDREGTKPEIIERDYDARRLMTDIQSTVAHQLRQEDVEFVELPKISHYRPVFVVRQSDTRAVIRALAALPAHSGWQVRAFGPDRKRMRSNRIDRHPELVRRVTVRREIEATNGRRMSTYRELLLIEPWDELDFNVPRTDGSTHLEGTLHRIWNTPQTFVTYIVPNRWRSAIDDHGGKLELGAPHLYEVSEPVDIVYTWVNGEDPDWIRRKRIAESGLDSATVNGTAVSDSRFESRDELRYSLRSVEHYASWVNRIFIVTDGQMPDWLNTDHPKVTLVDHREIFRRRESLPVFNSHAIESQLHRIPGLSERYLYLNDDIMFMRPVEPELFFTSNGMSKYFPSKATLDLSERSARDLPVMSAAKRGRDFMIERFGRTVTNKFKHTPHSQLKSVLEQFENEERELFDAVSASQFRHPDDFSIPSALYHYYAYAESKAIPGEIRYAYMDVAREDARVYLDRLRRRRDLDVLCLNDTHVEEDQRGEVNRLLAEFFEDRFPVTSSFERF